jgi:hypothetical protein
MELDKHLPPVAPLPGNATVVSITLAATKARFVRFGLVHLNVPALGVGIVELTDRVCRLLPQSSS